VAEKLLNDEITQQVKEVFSQMNNPVEVLYFGRQEDCAYCDDTRQLVEELTTLSDALSLAVYDIDQDAELAQQYGVDKVPGLVLVGRENGSRVDYGIRFAGIPSGHEFSSLVQGLLLVAGRDSGLSPASREALKALTSPVTLQVFVTPTCPYCPRAVVLAHQMALESPMVQAEMVEAMEFPELSERFGVSGVPQTTINEGKGTVIGAVPEDHLLQEIQAAL